MQAPEEPIFVTRPSLPPLAQLTPYLEQIWASRSLTNGGPLHQRLEKELAEYLGVPFVCLFNNGTNALMTAVQALGLTGEVITTPFSFIATANALVWNGVEPVFIDIDPETFNLDPTLIEDAITDQTTGILPVHCFGRPCDTEAIRRVAKKHGLKILYDAAHAFGVERDGTSILNEGDLSVLSFHATKVFNTFEGGAIICHDADMKARIESLRNFGIVGEAEATEVGLNGKMNEFQAAVGLAQLRQAGAELESRTHVAKAYRQSLHGVPGIVLPGRPSNVRGNESYFPILVDSSAPISRDAVHQELHSRGIFSRRYFFPLISDMAAYRRLNNTVRETPAARDIARHVLCLPMYSTLSTAQTSRIAEGIGSIVARAANGEPR